MVPDPSGYPDPGNPDFPEFFFAFFASTGLLGPQGHPLDGRESPNPDPDPGNPVFSKIRIFRFFDFLSLKTLQYGCLWTCLDPDR